MSAAEQRIEAVAAVLRDRLRPPFDPYEVTCYVLDALGEPLGTAQERVAALTAERDAIRAKTLTEVEEALRAEAQQTAAASRWGAHAGLSRALHVVASLPQRESKHAPGLLPPEDTSWRRNGEGTA